MAPIPDDADLVFDRSDPEPTDLVAAPGDDIEPVLVELGTGVFAFTHPTPRYGLSNVGLVIDSDGLTVIDTTGTGYRGRVIRSAIESLTAELDAPLKRVVLTSSRIPFSGGSAPFWAAAFYGSATASEELDQPLNLAAIRALLPDLAPAFHDRFETRPVTHTVDDEAWLTNSIHVVPLAGEAEQNLVVQTPGVGAIFAGALASFGVTPLAYAGNPAVWADTCERLAAAGGTVVPGHGSLGGAGDLLDLAAYLRACVAADGDPSAIGAGPWDGWTNREFDPVNVERAARLARGDAGVPQTMLELLGFA
jgi:cyclase